jgi:hypothetical protein
MYTLYTYSITVKIRTATAPLFTDESRRTKTYVDRLVEVYDPMRSDPGPGSSLGRNSRKWGKKPLFCISRTAIAGELYFCK